MKYIVLILIFSFPIFGQISEPNEITAFRTSQKIKIDGVLDENAWDEAIGVTNFSQRVQDEGEPGTQNTEVKIIYNDTELYIGVRLHDDNPSAIVAKQMKRDFYYWTEDNFVVIIDPYLSGRDGYIFAVNSNGAKSDVYSTDEARSFNTDWNGIWDAETKVDSAGWTAELKIPFSTLKFPDKLEQLWGINFQRRIIRTQEQDFWQGWNRNYNFEHVSNAGFLKGLKNIKGKETIEFKPYITAGMETNGSNKTVTKIGGDANYLITPTLKLNITANTDFAQVESDRAEINLSRFSLYFPEKREFFLEGQNFFSFDMLLDAKLFYSRRIGINDGNQIPILGGLRLMGTAGDTKLGVMSLQTGNGKGAATANYSTVRIKQNIFEKSYIGLIMSSRIDDSISNYNYGIDFNYKNSTLFGDKNLILNSSFAQSLFNSGNETNNYAYNFILTMPNDQFYFSSAYQKVMNNFAPQTGFVNRKNYDYIQSEYVYKPRLEESELIQQLTFKPYEVKIFVNDTTNEIEYFKYIVRPVGIVIESGDAFYMEYSREYEKIYNDFEIFGNYLIPEGEYEINRYSAEINTFNGRKYYMYAKYEWGGFFNGDIRSIYSSFNYNVNRNLNISADYSRNSVDLPNGSFDADEFGTRIEYAFNPEINTSLFGQWNNERDMMLLNFRFHWIPVPGSNIYFVLNQMVDTGNKISLKETALLTKVVWRFGV